MLCHGWGDNKGDMLQRGDFLRARFNLFLFDFRYHGDSEGDRTSLCACESWDIAAAYDCLKSKRPGRSGIARSASPTTTFTRLPSPASSALLFTNFAR